MSCLTRSLQKQLSQYIKKHVSRPWRQKPASLRDDLVHKGICPSDVTYDQFALIVESLSNN